MKTIRDTDSQWVEWKGRWEYELRSNGDIIGLLHFKQNQVTRAVAECAEGSWRFKKKWFPFDKVILFEGNTDKQVGVLRTKLARDRSSLEFPDGHLFYWEPTNVWRNKWIFTDSFGEHLLRFKRNSSPISALAAPRGHSTGKVEITRFGLYMYELPLLLLLGCYLMVVDSI